MNILKSFLNRYGLSFGLGVVITFLLMVIFSKDEFSAIKFESNGNGNFSLALNKSEIKADELFESIWSNNSSKLSIQDFMESKGFFKYDDVKMLDSLLTLKSITNFTVLLKKMSEDKTGPWTEIKIIDTAILVNIDNPTYKMPGGDTIYTHDKGEFVMKKIQLKSQDEYRKAVFIAMPGMGSPLKGKEHAHSFHLNKEQIESILGEQVKSGKAYLTVIESVE